MGPVSVFVLAVVLVLAPIMRGGNRHVAMVVLEAGSLLFLVLAMVRSSSRPRLGARGFLIALLATSPAWLAAIYLWPLPPAFWASLPGRGEYMQALAQARIPADHWFPLSLVPDATLTSVLAGIPLTAAFLGGLWLRARQARIVLGTVVAIAFAEVLLGLLQSGTGSESVLYFGRAEVRPLGSFANPNHFANYLALAFAAYVWLCWSRWVESSRAPGLPGQQQEERRRLVLWAAGGVLLVIGILMSRSRGAILAGLFAGTCAVALTVITSSRHQSKRRTLLVIAIGLFTALCLAGFDLALSRFNAEDLAGSARVRNLLASTTMEGAAQFWPLGAGWGTFEFTYPRFQPASITGTAGYAHQDYAQLLFEGGIFAVGLMSAFAWLCGSRAVHLVRNARRRGRLRNSEMLSAVCGLGLGGFLLHSLVEFNMHIPANAIVAALFAGLYLRSLEGEERVDD